MIPDRNKTKLTHAVTEAAKRWLEERGCKPCEFEVPVDWSWIADIGTVVTPTQTELQMFRLLPTRPRYGCKDYQTKNACWNTAYHNLQAKMTSGSMLTCLVEVKTSRADFRHDKKWNKPIPTNVAYLAAPKGMVKSTEWPTGWGILEYYETSKWGLNVIRCARVPDVQLQPIKAQLNTLMAVAVRCDHRTRYATQREIRQQARMEIVY